MPSGAHTSRGQEQIRRACILAALDDEHRNEGQGSGRPRRLVTWSVAYVHCWQARPSKGKAEKRQVEVGPSCQSERQLDVVKAATASAYYHPLLHSSHAMFRSRWTRGSPNKRQQQQQTALQEEQRHAPTPYPDQRKRGGRLQAAASALNLGPGPDLNAFDRSSSVTPGTPSTPATVHAFPPTGSHHQNLPHQQLRLPQSPLSTDATHGHTYQIGRAHV